MQRLINSPERQRAGVNCERGVLGSGCRANACNNGECSNQHMAPEARRVIQRQVGSILGLLGGTLLGLIARGLNLVRGGGGLGNLLPKFVSPESFHIVVAGGPAGKFAAICPGLGLLRPPAPTAGMSKVC